MADTFIYNATIIQKWTNKFILVLDILSFTPSVFTYTQTCEWTLKRFPKNSRELIFNIKFCIDLKEVLPILLIYCDSHK